MKHGRIGCRVAALMGFALLVAVPRAPAQVVLTLTISSDPSGMALGGGGTAAATLSFGSMQAFGGSNPAGVTRTTGASSWTISTPFDVKAVGIGLISPNYTLTAQLQSADTVNTWKVGAVTLSNAGPSVLATTGTYGSTLAFTFSLTIPFSASPGVVSNTVNLVATAN